MTRTRLAAGGLLLLTLASCKTGPPANTSGVKAPVSAPVGSSPAMRASATSPSAPASGGIMPRVVHTPGIFVDDMHLAALQCHGSGATAGTSVPDLACTPGAFDPAVTQANIAQTICKAGYTATVRPPVSATGPAKRRAMRAYGVDTRQAAAYEFDHLVPLSLGGASTSSNLWPELGATPNPKDSVENRLHREVCNGTITLAAAQGHIIANWTTAR